jgi:hypothetical protein
MRSQAFVVVSLLLLLPLLTTAVSGQSITGDVDEIELSGEFTFEGSELVPHSLLGELSEPQDNDSYNLTTSPETVHLLVITMVDAPIRIEVWENGALLAYIEGGVGLYLLFSSEGGELEIEISSVAFNGTNVYIVAGFAHAEDEVLGVAGLAASGFVHMDDDAGDVAVWDVGGNAPIRLDWTSAGDVEFTGHFIDSSGQMISFPMEGGNGSTEVRTPSTLHGSEQIQLFVTAKANGTGWWWVDHTVLEPRDDACVHDCPNLVDEESFETDSRSMVDESIWLTSGSLSAEDPADVYPIFIPGELWETHRLFATIEGEGVEVQIQAWNNSAEFPSPLAIETGTGTIGLNMTPGYHVVKVMGDGAYSLTVHAVNMSDASDEPIDPGEMVDLWREFIPFYIGIGVVMLLPLAWVIWSLRGTRMSNEIQAHERGRLRRLRERLAQLLSREVPDEEAIDSALKMLEAVQWRATEVEMGEATLTHHTGALTLKAWRLDGQNLLVGIHVEEQPWELAALRFHATAGSEWRVAEVSPAALFDGDEIFLDTLEVGTTRFLRLRLEGTAEGLDLHLSGLVDGKPLAAVPAQALIMAE